MFKLILLNVREDNKYEYIIGNKRYISDLEELNKVIDNEVEIAIFNISKSHLNAFNLNSKAVFDYRTVWVLLDGILDDFKRYLEVNNSNTLKLSKLLNNIENSNDILDKMNLIYLNKEFIIECDKIASNIEFTIDMEDILTYLNETDTVEFEDNLLDLRNLISNRIKQKDIFDRFTI